MKVEVEPTTAFCQVLRQQRLARQLTYQSLGLRAGLPSKFIFNLECGNERPSLDTVFKVAKALGYSGAGFVSLIERRIYGIDRELVSQSK
ncbi:MAG: hypothetical protein CBC42_00210 [Betaproteobacteria bacterium TMED82]|nr:MAG: hypothetical protein CBC42_00210 [Betaproteobacteria bacterium TMED82]|tara:strand:+ start:9752 stop:10021 length:270 start_codon:yes stop_codon:yes gene_type:complete